MRRRSAPDRRRIQPAPPPARWSGWPVRAPRREKRPSYANAGITSRANNSRVGGGAKSLKKIVNVVMPCAIRFLSASTICGGVPLIPVMENGFSPCAIFHFCATSSSVLPIQTSNCSEMSMLLRSRPTSLQCCKDVGRDLNSIDISEQLLVCIGKTEDEIAQKWKMAQGLKPFSITGIKGTPPQIVDALRKRIAQGITTFTIFFSDFAPPPTLELFAREVMPAFA